MISRAFWMEYLEHVNRAKTGDAAEWCHHTIKAQEALDAHFQALEVEAATFATYFEHAWLPMGGPRAWLKNGWDHRPINKARWAKKRKANY